MLSLTGGRKIATIDDDRKKFIFLKEDASDKDEPEIDTTEEQKLNMFTKFLRLDKKLSPTEQDQITKAYEDESLVASLSPKLHRKLEDGKLYVKESLKTHLDYGSAHELFPIVTDESYRMYVSGLSGSGKSHFIAEFLKHNKLREKGAGIFLFSPITNDKSLSKIKNLIQINLDGFREENKGRSLEPEDIPEGSVCIFDDCESFPKHVAKEYLELRDIIAERGRHRRVSLISVSHNATNGNTTKVQIRESQYWVLFPKFNARDTRNILKVYGGLGKEQIEHIMDMKSRWVFYRKAIPKYAVSQHSVISFD